MTEEVQTEAAVISAPEVEVTATIPADSTPVKTFTQDELDAIVTKRLAKEQRKMSRQVELEVENRLLKEQVTRREVKQTEQSAVVPKQDDYSTYEEYLEAKAGFLAEKKVQETLAEREKKEAQSRQEAERNKVVSTWQEKVEKASSKYVDYNDVLEAVDHIEIPEALQLAIMENDHGADLAYSLGKNPAELQRIVSLKPHAALMELGKLAAKLSDPAPSPKPTLSKAPDPIKPLGGISVVDTAHSPNDDYATFVRKRNLEKGRIR